MPAPSRWRPSVRGPEDWDVEDSILYLHPAMYLVFRVPSRAGGGAGREADLGLGIVFKLGGFVGAELEGDPRTTCSGSRPNKRDARHTNNRAIKERSVIPRNCLQTSFLAAGGRGWGSWFLHLRHLPKALALGFFPAPRRDEALQGVHILVEMF